MNSDSDNQKSNSKTIKILLIEDNPGDADLIEEMLSKTDVRFELKCTARLFSGIEQIKANGFDVILLDLGLPDSQGLSTLIKLNEIRPEAPVIVLTGLADETVGAQAVTEGAQDYLIKGQIDRNMLARSINYAIERKKALDSVLAAAREWSASFDAMSDGVSIHSIDHTIINANESLCQLLGKTVDELIGRKCYQLFHEKDCPISDCPLNKTKDTNQRAHMEIFEPALNKWLAISTSPVFDNFGFLTKIVHTVRDVSEHKKLEEQLRHAQKMEAVGTLAGGIAHDFNNILNVIIGYGSMVQDGLEAGSPAKEQMQEVLGAAEKAANLTKRLLLFSRKTAAEFKPMALNEMVINMEKMLSRIIGEDINLVADLMGAKAMVMADAGQMEQVLLNLATNARDAMPEGGSLTIKTELKNIDTEFIKAYEYGVPGTYAVISITDTGTGIDKEKQARIFDPFFTTKEVGKGTGLGLSIVYGIIKQHNGYIKAYSETGKGTTFKIWLPVIEDIAEKKPEAGALASQKGGTETILVAEDDASLRKLTRVVLESFGYTVITAEDGEDAITKFMENRDHVQLVMLDMIMPKKNGKEVGETIRKESPLTKILFVSGYTMDTVKTQELTEAGFDFILKPVIPKDLLKKVREILDR